LSSRVFEILVLSSGVLLSIGSIFYGSQAVSIGVFAGAMFSSINLRLMVWGWSSVIQQQVSPDSVSAIDIVPRFLIKFVFLIAGLFVSMVTLKINPYGFAIGTSSIILAVMLCPLLPKKPE
jgi:hypothetical protein